MRLPTIAGVMPSSRAAAERLPRWATSTKVVNSLKRSTSGSMKSYDDSRYLHHASWGINDAEQRSAKKNARARLGTSIAA